tara:strand:+ start:358 stop:882 length:525 start_codon:yes stop_codon:yes gene_type:complete
MTLPFADKPENSRVYTDLKELNLSQLTFNEFDALEESIKSQGTDGLEDEYRRLVLLKLAAGELTSPAVTGTMKNLNITDTTGTGNPTGVLFRPNKGEVWQVCGISTGTLNASRADVLLWDGTVGVKLGQETSASLMFEPPGITPVYITYDVRLQYQFISATGNCTIRCSVIRIR